MQLVLCIVSLIFTGGDMSKQILVLGSINVDHVLRVNRFPKPGQTITGSSYNIMAGGKGANQAVACARLGGNTHMMAAIGQDDLGREIVQQLSDEGVDTTAITEVVDMDTGVALIFVNAKGENIIGISAGANGCLREEHIEQNHSLITDADYLLLQQEVPESVILQAAHIARENNTKVALNPAPAREFSNDYLLAIDLITPNQTEAEIITGIKASDEKSARQAAGILHEKGIPDVAITMGQIGVYVSSISSGHPKGLIVPGFPVKAVDTTAAGDTFNGALLVALAEGKSLEDAALFANASAGLSVMSAGSQSSIPYRFQVEEFIQCDQEIAGALETLHTS
ncbi:ribokinase [Endozoicomonas atrinae]|uniref:ribokinase n=1 Tax=Endozoicomonas atrinae TaxID=1333660 RepID=UPI000A6C13E3|nr:ribokinase [Endozoicomonas atrinae]